MDSNNFISWLRGFLDASESDTLSSTQTNIIKEKLLQTFEVRCGGISSPPPVNPYSPPWVIGDQPYDPNKIWYTNYTTSPPFSSTTNQS